MYRLHQYQRCSNTGRAEPLCLSAIGAYNSWCTSAILIKDYKTYLAPVLRGNAERVIAHPAYPIRTHSEAVPKGIYSIPMDKKNVTITCLPFLQTS